MQPHKFLLSEVWLVAAIFEFFCRPQKDERDSQIGNFLDLAEVVWKIF